MTDDVSSRILTAATLAEKHGEELGRFTLLWPRQAGQTTLRHLMRASGPSHWGAVAELLREMVQLHREHPDVPNSGDRSRSLNLLLPLVDQIIRDLGDGQ